MIKQQEKDRFTLKIDSSLKSFLNYKKEKNNTTIESLLQNSVLTTYREEIESYMYVKEGIKPVVDLLDDELSEIVDNGHENSLYYKMCIQEYEDRLEKKFKEYREGKEIEYYKSLKQNS